MMKTTDRTVPASEIAVKVWDLPLRIFHWGLTAFFIVAYLSGRDAEYFWLHRASGIAMLVLVVFRVIWGFIGPRPARFAGLLQGPQAVIAHLRDLVARAHRPVLGHNALGGWAVLVILALIFAELLSGLFSSTFDDEGPLARLLSDSGSSAMAVAHAVIANLLVAMVIVHLAGVVLTSVLGRENLIASMIHGRKPRPIQAIEPAQAIEIDEAPAWWKAPTAMVGAVLAVWALLSLPSFYG